MNASDPNVPQSGGETRREPWIGLTPYSESESDLFSGRDKEARELFRLVKRSVLTVLFGPSGTGKTSLLQAGLFPLLRQEHYLPVPIRLDHSGRIASHAEAVCLHIARALERNRIEEAQTAEAQVPSGQETLWEYIHRHDYWDSRNQPVIPVLVFDQFEEIFTLGESRPESGAFLKELADAVENYVPESIRAQLEHGSQRLGFDPHEQRFKVIVSLRGDYVYLLDRLRRSMPSVMHNRFQLERLNGEQALEAVAKPGRGIVSDEVARGVVRFVAAADESGPEVNSEVDLTSLSIEPALLSVVCRELNSRRLREGRDRINLEDLKVGEADILKDFYEHSYDGLGPDARVFVEDRLLTASGYRSTVPMEEAVFAGLSDEDIRRLVDRRLIRKEERLGIPHLELTHDLLTGVVQKSRDARRERESRERYEQERLELEGERRRKVKAARTVAIFFSVLAVVFLLLLVLAFTSWREASAEREKADEARRNADDALATVVDLGESFEEQSEGTPLFFEGLAADLRRFSDISLIRGRIHHFRGLAGLARAGECLRESDESGVRFFGRQALDEFEQYLQLARQGLDSGQDQEQRKWMREVGKALQASGDARRVLGMSDVALRNYEQALTQFEQLVNREEQGHETEEAALDLAGLYVRMGDASLEMKNTATAFEHYGNANNVLKKYFGESGMQADPHTKYAIQSVTAKLFRSESMLKGIDINPVEWVTRYLKASRGPTADTLREFYSDTVSPFYSLKSAQWEAIKRDKENFFRGFPSLEYTLVGGNVETEHPTAEQTRKILTFEVDYRNTAADGTVQRGRVRRTLDLQFVERQWKIVGERESSVQ